jgi:hypothetical protein
MAKAKKTVTVYVVRRLDWDDSYRNEEELEANSVRIFLTSAQAEAHRPQLERQERGDLSPFDFGGGLSDFSAYSTLAEETFAARMDAAGLPRPPVGRRRQTVDYSDWFEQLPEFTDGQRHAIWDALDLVRLLEVVPLQVELEGPMVRSKPERLFVVEKRLATIADMDSCKAPLPHLAKMSAPYPSRKGYIFLKVYALHEGHHPLRAFLDEQQAEAFCKAREDEAWEGINPFRYGRRADWTSLDAGRLRDMMLDIGLEPPAGKFDAARWRKWYDVASGSASELQKMEVRQVLDRLHFFRVTELAS